MNQTLVSIIIPTHNRCNWLCQAIDSVLRQKVGPLEIIVVDDESTDDTQDAILGFGDRVRYIRQSQQGVSAARNLGFKVSRGQWIAFLDSDDLWLPEKLECQISSLNSGKTFRACYTDEIWIRNGRRVNQKARHAKYSGWIFPHVLPLCIISPSSILMRRDLIEEIIKRDGWLFDEQLPVCEDYDLWIRLAAVEPILFLPERLIVKHGGHKDQLSKSLWGMDRFRIKALEAAYHKPWLEKWQKALVSEWIVKKSKIVAGGAIKRGKDKDGYWYLKKADVYRNNRRKFSAPGKKFARP